MNRISEEFSGPPAVISQMALKLFTVRISVRIIAIAKASRICGSTMKKSMRQPCAPSICAASVTERGIICSAASSSSMTKGVPFQMLSTVTAHSAVRTSPRMGKYS